MVITGMSSTDRLLTPAILATLAELDLTDADAGAAQLARRMSQQIDDAAWVERAADKILEAVAEKGWVAGDSIYDEVDALRRKLSARLAVSDIGPKLLAVLDDLGATPMSRAKLSKLVPQGASGPVAGGATMARLKGRLGA
jgi:hypothetical protein